jgi:hypothetical protein
LAIINVFKQGILKPLADELFLWRIANYHKVKKAVELNNFHISGSKEVVEVEQVVGSGGVGTSINERRGRIYDLATRNLPQAHKDLLKKLTGRNSEIAFLIFFMCDVVGYDLTSDLTKMEEVMMEKETTEDSSGYSDTFKEFLKQEFAKIGGMSEWIKKEGTGKGYPFFPRTRVLDDWNQYVYDHRIKNTFGTQIFGRWLKDNGFIDGLNCFNIKVQGMPIKCLVFDAIVQNKIMGKSLVADVPEVTEERVLSNEDVLLETIGRCDAGQGATFESILRVTAMAETELEPLLQRCVTTGLVFQVRPGVYKILK